MAYGQSGGGKTHSLIGFNADPEGEERGCIPRTVQDLFDQIADLEADGQEVQIRSALFEVYGEEVYDLLNVDEDGNTVRVRNPKSERDMEALYNRVLTSVNDAMATFVEGNSRRRVAPMRLNPQSSRSHCIFVIRIRRRYKSGATSIANLFFVDLQVS